MDNSDGSMPGGYGSVGGGGGFSTSQVGGCGAGGISESK